MIYPGDDLICSSRIEYDSLELIINAGVSVSMPKTVEAKCTNEECELDMIELHYTYDMSEDTTIDDFVCPYCRSDALEEIVF